MIAGTRSTKKDRLAALIAERGLLTSGFARSLRALVREMNPEEEFDLEICGYEEACDLTFEDWFDPCRVIPAAYRIRREGDDIQDVTVEVYEVEGSQEIPQWKLEYYGDLADRDGPRLDLHILDKYDHEIIIESNELEYFAVMYAWPEDKKEGVLKQVRSRATAQHHAPAIIERSADPSQITTARLDDIIYGLGAGRSHKEIALHAGVESAAVRAIANLLADNNINPKEMVKETHAKWKAAYDAVRELGVQL